MNVHIPETRLIDLAAGLLSPDEERDVIGHLRHCAECEGRFRLIVADGESARSTPAPLLVDKKIQLPRTNRRPTILVSSVVAAAVVTLVVVGVLLTNRPDEVGDYWIPVTGEAVTLRSTNDALANALRAYETHNANAAIEQLEAYTPDFNDKAAATVRNVCLASALVNGGLPDDGLALLDSSKVDYLPDPWRGHAQWVRYVALRRTDRDTEANDLLKALATDDGEFGEKARLELQHHR